MATSAWEGAARGLESGFQMAMNWSQTQKQNARADAQDARQARLDQQSLDDRQYARDRTQMGDQLAASGTQLTDVKARIAALQASGKGADDSTLQSLTDQATALDARHQALLAKQGGYDPEKVKATANAGMQALQNNDIGTLMKNPGMLSQAIFEKTGHPLSYYQRKPDGSPSEHEQAFADVHEGLQSDDHERLIRGANTILAPELNKMVGTQAREGGVIHSVRLIAAVPDPRSPPGQLHVIPTVRIYVDNGKKEDRPFDVKMPSTPLEGAASAAAPQGQPQQAPVGPASDNPALPAPTETAASGAQTFPVAAQPPANPRDVNAPPGATGHYDTHITRDRSTATTDPVLPISANGFMDKAGQGMELVNLVNAPEAQPLMASEAAAHWDAGTYKKLQYERQLAALGITPPKPKVTLEKVGAGQNIAQISTDPVTGLSKNLGNVAEGQERSYALGDLANTSAAIDSMVESGAMSAAQGDALKAQAAKTKAAGGAAGLNGAKGSGSVRDLELERKVLKDRYERIKGSSEAAQKAVVDAETALKNHDGRKLRSAEKPQAATDREALVAAVGKAREEAQSARQALKDATTEVDKSEKAGLADARGPDTKVSPAQQAANDKDRIPIMQGERDRAAAALAKATDADDKTRKTEDLAAIDRELAKLGVKPATSLESAKPAPAASASAPPPPSKQAPRILKYNKAGEPVS